jgi:TolA-binding protein
MKHDVYGRWSALGVGLALLGLAWSAAAAETLSPEEAAAVLLDSANRAYNEQKFDFASERYREFIKLYGAQREVARAEYGLGLALLDGPRKDYEAAVPVLQSAAGRGDFADRPYVLYYLGLARRTLAEKALALPAAATPAEAEARRNAINQRLSEAAGSFAEAANLFLVRLGTVSPTGERPTELDWAARARCDYADLLLRLGKNKEAAEAAEACLKEAAPARSPYREQALYQQGYARFGLKEYLPAGRALSQLAPFAQSFGLHARYLLGRIHHLAEARPEAALQYRAVLADYDQRRKAAQAAMQNPNALTAERREAYTQLLNGPAPEYLARTAFYLALLTCENENYGDALAGFTAFIKQNPTSSYLAEAQLRQGFCRLQLGNYAEAMTVLQTLTNQPARADRALWWLARCQTKSADPKTAATYDVTLKSAAENLRRAADLTGFLTQTDPDAKFRRSEILMELADTLILAKQYKDAADVYQRVQQESPASTRSEEAMQRRVTVLQLGGWYRESDELGAQFEQTNPESVLLPVVLFRRSENAYLMATTTNSAASMPNRATEVPRLFGEAIARCQRIMERYPDCAYINQARETAGVSYYRLGKFKDAVEMLRGIPAEACVDGLAGVPYLMADSLIRCAPQDPTDAIAAADLLDKARQAAKQLDKFIAANEKSPQLPDALLKLGWCCSRVGELTQAVDERKQVLASGRAAYDRLIQQYAQDPAVPQAVLERAGVQAAQGELAPAITELNRFTQEPLRSSSTATLALSRLAVLLRSQNRGLEAATAIQQYRSQCETNLLRDSMQSNSVAALQYEQAMGWKQGGKTAEARALFESILKQFPGHPVAVNAAWRATQSRREELSVQVEAARQVLGRAGVRPEEQAAAQRSLGEAMNGIRDAVFALQARADTLGRGAPGSPAHLDALYEIAWSCRSLAEVELELAVRQLRQEAVERLRVKLGKQLPAGQAPAAIREPEIAVADVAMPLSERTALEYYERLVVAAPEAPLACQARVELAELYARRGQYEQAARALSAALNQRPAPELVPQIRVRLAAASLGCKKFAVAQGQAEAVALEAASPLASYARYLMGEACFQQQEWKRAIDRLAPFRDQGALQNVPDVSDRALLRLGEAYLKIAQFDACRQTLAALSQRFPQSPWIDEALYTIGLACQKQEQYDQAVEAFRQVTGRTASAWGAQAQLQIGLCRMAQKRPADARQAFLAVPFTYDYPEWQAPAYVEAARASLELKQGEIAVLYLQKVTQQYAGSPWAQAARDQLDAMEKNQ